MISAAELLAFMPIARPGDLATWGMLFDATGARTSVIGSEVGDIVQQSRALVNGGPRGPVAIVVTGSNVGLARMYMTLITGVNLEVRMFSDAALAEAWLMSQS
jgi:hypothetical protein